VISEKSPVVEDFDKFTITQFAGTGIPNGPSNFTISTGSTSTVYQSNDNGSSAAGGVYSYGSTFSNERALGWFLEPKVSTSFKAVARFTNGGTSDINTLTISYRGEQWRRGVSTNNPNGFNVKLKDADGETALPDLRFETPYFNIPNGGATPEPLNGNDSRYFEMLTTTVRGLTIAPNESFELTFSNIDGFNAHGIAIDDLSVKVAPAVIPEPLAAAGGLLIGGVMLRRRRR
jgi:hypothetical protein